MNRQVILDRLNPKLRREVAPREGWVGQAGILAPTSSQPELSAGAHHLENLLTKPTLASFEWRAKIVAVAGAGTPRHSSTLLTSLSGGTPRTTS